MHHGVKAVFRDDRAAGGIAQAGLLGEAPPQPVPSRAQLVGIVGAITTSPSPPTIGRTSPTSVATTGISQAMASPTTLGKPSPKADDRVAMSKAL